MDVSGFDLLELGLRFRQVARWRGFEADKADLVAYEFLLRQVESGNARGPHDESDINLSAALQ